LKEKEKLEETMMPIIKMIGGEVVGGAEVKAMEDQEV
jgi:hypothetical protein